MYWANINLSLTPTKLYLQNKNFAARLKSMTTRSLEFGKMFFASLQKLFSFSRKSTFSNFTFSKSTFSNFMTSSLKRKYISLNNLGSKYSLLMKFGQFLPHYKRKNFIKKYYKNCGLKQVQGPFVFAKN